MTFVITQTSASTACFAANPRLASTPSQQSAANPKLAPLM
jgi:hypothetical protein